MSKGSDKNAPPSMGAAAFGQGFFLSALLQGLYDFIVANWIEPIDFEGIISLIRLTPLTLAAVPAAVGLSALLAGWISLGLLSRSPHPRAVSLAVNLALAAVPATLVTSLFSGPAIRASAWRYPLIALCCAAVVAGISLIRFFAGRCCLQLRRLDKPRRQWTAVLCATAIAASLTGIHFATVSILPGLYEAFHQCLSLVALVLCAGVTVVLFSTSGRQPKPKRIAVGLAAVVIVGGTVGFFTGRTAALGRQLIAERGPYLGPFSGPFFTLDQRLAGVVADSALQGDEFQGARPVLAAARFEDGAPKRSVLLITVDSLRGDALDSEGPLVRETERLRQLARSALCFSRAYSPGNNTGTSLPGMLFGHASWAAEEKFTAHGSLPWVFNRAGYQTILYFTAHDYAPLKEARVWPLASRGFFFQYYFKAYETALQVVGKVRRRLGRTTAPMFIWAHLSELHSPFFLRQRADSPTARFDNSYRGQLAFVDSVLGPFFQDLRSDYPQLVWAFSSDHGEALGEHGMMHHGSSMYDEQIRVPLILGGPGVRDGIVSKPVSTSDLGATLLELAGATVDRCNVLGPEPRPSECAHESVLIVGGRSCAIIDRNWKLIADMGRGIASLYDLESDPQEQQNAIASNRALALELLDQMGMLGCPFDLSGIERIL